MEFPKSNDNERKEILKRLRELVKQNKKQKSFKRWYHRNSDFFWLIISTIFLLLFIFTIGILISKFDLSFLFSTIALLISGGNFIIRIRNYPVDDLEIKKLKDEENYYELIFSIKNSGYGKLKLDFAIYFIESINKESDSNSFLICNTKSISTYLNELISRIKQDKIRVFSLASITKEYGVFFTHNDIHLESRLLRFDENKIYMITFLFQTSHKVFYYISRYLIH
ncbi:MAG: hypothetical protein ACTSPQ_17425 [Candidatus Helarchaeota archaeon]